MDGIFFDETPSQYTPINYAYMLNLTTFARTTELNSQPPPSNNVIFNPGAVADSQYYALANYINAFENSWSAYDDTVFNWIPEPYWEQTVFMIYGFKGTLAQQNSAVQDVKGKRLGGLFMSTQTVYTAVSSYWSQFCVDMLDYSPMQSTESRNPQSSTSGKNVANAPE